MYTHMNHTCIVFQIVSPLTALAYLLVKKEKTCLVTKNDFSLFI